MVTIEDLFKNLCFSASHFLKCPSSLKHSCPPPHKKPPTHSLLKMKGAEYRYFNQYVNHSYNLLWFHQYSSITNSGEFSCWPDPQNLIYVHWSAILNAQYCLDHLATNFMSPRNWDFPLIYLKLKKCNWWLNFTSQLINCNLSPEPLAYHAALTTEPLRPDRNIDWQIWDTPVN